MDRIAIVTGGSRGIGAATATLAAKAGYRVCIAYLTREAAAQATVAAIHADGTYAAIQKKYVGELDIYNE